jgi:hypothetical protein
MRRTTQSLARPLPRCPAFSTASDCSSRLTFAALDRLFGLNPLGYHIVNAFLLVAVAWLFYLVLRELRLPRLLCVALPLVYSTLPHYATNRFGSTPSRSR